MAAVGRCGYRSRAQKGWFCISRSTVRSVDQNFVLRIKVVDIYDPVSLSKGLTGEPEDT